MLKRWLVAAAAVLAIAGGTVRLASADDHIRVSNAAPASAFFAALYLGIDKGIFKKYQLDVEPIDIFGPAKSQEAMTAGSVDFELGSGSELIYVAKGVKELAVASIVGPPTLVDLVVRKDGPIKTVADLKGKTISIISVGSLTEWLARELSRRQGWGSDGIKVQAVGSAAAQSAMLQTGQVDASIIEISSARILADKGEARRLISGRDIAPNFITHAIYASKAMIDTKPDVVKRFLAAWFETQTYMKTHKADGVAIIVKRLQIPDAVAASDYDTLMPDFSKDGKFSPAALKVLSQSFVQMGTLPAEPDMSKLYTEAFLPPPGK
jgi:ABC-type nitrate/sulfonate/bicarbonate transport system substrate-binding protein